VNNENQQSGQVTLATMAGKGSSTVQSSLVKLDKGTKILAAEKSIRLPEIKQSRLSK